jgi:hypothetical protein
VPAVLTRRAFLLSSASLSVGCALHRASVDGGMPASVRGPSVGQSWRYAKIGILSGRLADSQVDQIAAVDGSVRIDSRSEPFANAPKKSWGRRVLSSYVARENPVGPLPGEVQEPWGNVLVDPHWSEVQTYEMPIPLWPQELRPGWSSRFFTKYTTRSHDDGLSWDQTMSAHAWEVVSVPAGKFTALRYTNVIDFTDVDGSRSACRRKETLWFAPEVGRFVIRESGGSYYLTNSADDTPHTESSYRWELQSYT